MRINKFLAKCGLGSRRSVEELIEKGKIKINNVVCNDLSSTVNIQEDVVTCEDKALKIIEEKVYFALNKPKGYVVSRKDEFGRKTVFDLLPDIGIPLFPVGRLDKDSEGLLLITNDGDFAERVLHPRYKLEKVYKVEIRGKIRKDDLKQLQEGVVISGEKTLPAKVFVKKRETESSVLRFTICEGKNRQIRKMVEGLGYSVINLRRLQIAGVRLGNLGIGMYRLLKPGEVASIQQQALGKRIRDKKTGKRKNNYEKKRL